MQRRENVVTNEAPVAPTVWDGIAPRLWTRHWTLTSHLDGARGVQCDSQGCMLVSCGEDALVKCWDLHGSNDGLPFAHDSEPFDTLRGHSAPVLALALQEQDSLVFSA